MKAFVDEHRDVHRAEPICTVALLMRVLGGSRGRAGEQDEVAPLWRRRIGMVFQSYALFPHMTVADNVAYGLHRQGARGGALKAEVDRALALVDMGSLGARRPKQLSGGQQQRVALARAS